MALLSLVTIEQLGGEWTGIKCELYGGEGKGEVS